MSLNRATAPMAKSVDATHSKCVVLRREGSIPSWGTNPIWFFLYNSREVDFSFLRLPYSAPLAQWLEQGSFKPWVVGSSPTGGTTAVGGTAGNRECNPVARRIGRAIKSVRVECALNTIIPLEKAIAPQQWQVANG